MADLDVDHNIEIPIPNPPMPSKNLKFGMSLESMHIPLSEASTKTFDSTLPPLPPANLDFGMLPKGPTPPSEPSKPPHKPPPFRL
ncbi:hypothetical protein L195_g056321 [Trifolium pratense]|uniref:Uncharacterized protein n=1 Tax=Trifolium pratense TaxID=57577 RepID=A0A2K3KR14_TRIPR|nr:hypothetical protein L195_g056321 [Trifolium pratense]